MSESLSFQKHLENVFSSDHPTKKGVIRRLLLKIHTLKVINFLRYAIPSPFLMVLFSFSLLVCSVLCVSVVCTFIYVFVLSSQHVCGLFDTGRSSRAPFVAPCFESESMFDQPDNETTSAVNSSPSSPRGTIKTKKPAETTNTGSDIPEKKKPVFGLNFKEFMEKSKELVCMAIDYRCWSVLCSGSPNVFVVKRNICR